MHQTFYIDIDEEITSVVEKLRKARQEEIILAVPKHALLIQSIVNLKILAKEANEMGLRISIVTQDKLGKLLVKKAGITIQQKVEDEYEDRDEIEHDQIPEQESVAVDSGFHHSEGAESGNDARRRLDRIGTSEYFSEDGGVENLEQEVDNSRKRRGVENGNINQQENFEKEIEKDYNEYVANLGRKKAIIKRNIPSMDVAVKKNPKTKSGGNQMDLPRQQRYQKSIPVDPRLRKQTDNDTGNPEKQYEVRQTKNNHKDQQLEDFFYSNNYSNKASEAADGQKAVKKGGGVMMKMAITLLIAGIFSGLTYLAYIFIPQATVTIYVKKEIKSADTEVQCDVNLESLDYEKAAIPAKLLEFDEEFAKNFDSSGSKSVSNKKAKGKISIYNEFSPAPQALVATTRFLSEDQKLFRLVQGVTVPGTTKVGDEIKPGVVEAEIVADEAGDQYNINPTKFSIPGFKNSGNEKYAKIYAQSSANMTGGGGSNDAVKTVVEKDINEAKDKFSLEINKLMKERIESSVDKSLILLDDAISVDEPVFIVSNAVGDVADSIKITIKAKGRALVFSESDMKKIANYIVSKSGNGKTNIDNGSVMLDYGKPTSDFRLGTLSVKIHASSVIQPEINLENLRREILGKNSEELEEYLKKYPIEKAMVEYSPESFVTSVPKNENRVSIILESALP